MSEGYHFIKPIKIGDEAIKEQKMLDIAFENSPTIMLLVDSDCRVERINKIGLQSIGKDLDKILGMLAGDIFSCVHASEPNGCGGTPSCSTCPVRTTITNTVRTASNKYNAEGVIEIFIGNSSVSIRDVIISTVYVNFHGDKKVVVYLDDVTERKKAEKTIKESEERFHALYENIPGGTMIIGKDYTIEDVNQRTCEVTGYEKEELIGQSCDILFPGCSLSRQCPLSEDDLDGVQCMDTTIICKDGTKVPILKNTKKIFINGEKYILGILEDISDLKEAERATADAMFLAEEANRIKSEFIANMSHELRTPLNSVNGYSEVLLEETGDILDERHRKFLKFISISGNRLLKLINEILDVSKIESGKLEVNYREVDAGEVFERILDDISPLAKKKNIELNISTVPEKFSLYADQFLLKQILLNLVSNAIKFTPDGGNIILKANLMDDVAEFSVVDTGIGISTEDIGKLFIPFYQIDSRLSRKYAGTGLGLSLVKRFVEMHGGEVLVESEPGKGSNFTFKIPARLHLAELSGA
ncbi:ATP-binding protein [Methanolobus sp. ZRKC2]|uniref:PAS domain-containing sensor histidine kinase n=1 Tax=Methanolobus sp. ZRKC2 TaxID=3125783 RepID=UPI0032519195